MTTDIYTLDWVEPTRAFGTDFNGQVAGLDDDRIAIIDHDPDTKKSTLAIVDQSPTGSAASSADTQDWPALDREFGRKQWQAYIRDHEMESQAMIRERTPIAVTATIHLADYGEKFDFITFETEDGEQLEWIDENGHTEEGVYVLASEDPESYDKAAEKWLERLHGRYEVTEWA